MSQKFYKNKGIILVDVILAFSAAAIFAVIIMQSLLEAQFLFENSKERNFLLDLYESHANEFTDMVPYESRSILVHTPSGPVEIRAKALWYGNERVETLVTVDNQLTIESVRAYDVENKKMKGVSLCSVDIASAFGQPRDILIAPILLPIDPLLPLTDLEVRNKIAYVSADSNRTIDPDILIFDISSTTNSKLLNSISTGPGIASIVFVENKIFAAANSTAAQLHIIGISDNYALSVLGKYSLLLPSTTTPPTVGSSISYYNDHIFLGTAKWGGTEFNIFKIENNELSYQSGYEIGSKINDIFVVQDRAYVAASSVDQLLLFDIQDITNLVLSDTFSPSGWSRQEVKTISFFEDFLNFGRTSGGFDIRTDHELFQKTSTTTFSELDFSNSYNMPGGVYGIVSNRSKTFVISREAGKELQVFSTSILGGPVDTYSLPVAPQKLICDNDHLYLLAASAPVIYEIFFK